MNRSALAMAESPAKTAVPPASFEDVYENHFDFVWRTVRRLGVAESSVEDIVQEVFLVVHKKLGEFEGRSSIKTWLFAIVLQFVRHHRRTIVRKDSRHVSAEGARDPDLLADAQQSSPLQSAERADTIRLLDRLLRDLDDEKREVFVLAEVEQLTAGEIAEVLGIKPNTVYSRLRVAREEFEQALARYRARENWRKP